jgi:hypothetical protein
MLSYFAAWILKISMVFKKRSGPEIRRGNQTRAEAGSCVMAGHDLAR